MIFGGLQKLTLLDFSGKVACTVFTKGCNFRCPFCHNALLVNKTEESATFSEEEILNFLAKRQGILEGICITGGEPLLHIELEDFIKKVKRLGYKVKLDTNGSLPDRLKSLVSQNIIDYVAMDIKNCKEKYADTAGVKSLDIRAIEESVDFLLSGSVDFEFRTTVVKEFHSVEDIENAAKWIKGADKYYLQAFVDSGDLIMPGFSSHNTEIMTEMRDIAALYVKNAEIRGI